MPVRQKERHLIGRIGWLRAAVLGANDGILSTASLVLGVASSHANQAGKCPPTRCRQTGRIWSYNGS